jgi:hypothetical protein
MLNHYQVTVQAEGKKNEKRKKIIQINGNLTRRSTPDVTQGAGAEE